VEVEETGQEPPPMPPPRRGSVPGVTIPRSLPRDDITPTAEEGAQEGREAPPPLGDKPDKERGGTMDAAEWYRQACEDEHEDKCAGMKESSIERSLSPEFPAVPGGKEESNTAAEITEPPPPTIQGKPAWKAAWEASKAIVEPPAGPREEASSGTPTP